MSTKWIVISIIIMLLAAGCRVVPGTGDTANDPAAAQRFLPTIPGYTSTDATSVSDALTRVGAGSALLTGNLPLAGAIAKLDGMIQCYRSVGAIAARVYTEQNIASVTGIPKIGVLAVVNTTRIQRNLLACALNTGIGAQRADEIQPCGGSGDITVNGENISYVFAATTPELCTVFQAQFTPR